ncbi:Predicted arabinose efflux permease, MFS family [Saccharopolyspora kobensis]|uniref:Predicted arabinose efflux permease, MFS family n=1 Tax=Saccharopolyspora kobensis TaxID=146035 RepID=A0A1H6DUC2_9PSEU|nr:MFS transporter [Saccharopolyspora kobensis]SEG88296.1 Predicted arabinose efflux permease, MFS family [Saccharopolyspora kobensis]SFE01919.1 Predicted arabinose efflux permease, MFS family [Saccharopolyspora kobensis]
MTDRLVEDAPPEVAAPARPRDRSAHNTVVLVVFTAITNLADGVVKMALPLMATTLTSSPGLVAAVSLTLTLPWLLTALHVGVLVDRFDRRKLLWLANFMRLLTLAVLLFVHFSDGITIPLLLIGGAVLGIAEVIALTSAMALTPTAVGPHWRERANAWITGAETVCNEFCGPLVGGLLVAVGSAFALGATAASYVLGTVVLVLLVGRFRVPREANEPRESVSRQIGSGLRYVWNQQLLRLMALVLTVLCSCWGAWLALMPLMATTELGLDAREWGMLLSALGIGGLVGALTVTTVNRLIGRRWALFADLVGTLAMVVTPVLTTELWILAAGAFLGGMGGTLWVVNARTIAQYLVEPEMMGRYSSVARLFSWGAMPIGAGLVGLLAEIFGMRAAFVIFAVAVLITIPPFLRTVTPQVLAAVDEAKRRQIDAAGSTEH